MRTSPGIVTSTFLTSFLPLSTISGLRASTRVSHWIVKSHTILYSLFSVTAPGSCSFILLHEPENIMRLSQSMLTAINKHFIVLVFHNDVWLISFDGPVSKYWKVSKNRYIFSLGCSPTTVLVLFVRSFGLISISHVATF